MKLNKFLKSITFISIIFVIFLIPVKVLNMNIPNDLYDEIYFQDEIKKADLQQNLFNKEDIDDINIVINAIGDCALGYDESFGKYGTFDEELIKHNNDYGHFFKNVKHIFEKGDLTIANLETTFTNSSYKADKEYAFKGDPSYSKILKEGNIDAVNLANNHTFDYLRQGFDDTIKALDREKIGYFGYGYKYMKDAKGIKIGVLGYTGFDNSAWTKKQIKKDINELREKVDILIISFHWGEENSYNPNKIQKDLGHFVIDEGADLVIGHHPHVLQGIEEYKGKVIAYSLGNFSFGGNRNPKDKDSIIFQQIFTFNSKRQLIKINTNIIPVSISSEKNRNDYTPVLLDGLERERVLNKINELSKKLINTID